MWTAGRTKFEKMILSYSESLIADAALTGRVRVGKGAARASQNA